MIKVKNILCIGAGYVGGPTMAVMALKCPQYNFHIVDINQSRIDAWNSDNLPIFEPGLEEVVKEARGRNLKFSTDVEQGVKDAEMIFVSVNTPTKTFGLGAGEAADLQYWEKTARMIAEVSESSKIVVEKSTLPVRTAEAMSRILKSNSKDISFEVLSNPEFLAEGTAIQDLLNPDRVLIGSEQTKSGLQACQELVNIYKEWVAAEKVLTANIWSAELSKLVANAFLAQRVSSINSISALCEATEANVEEVSLAIGTDTRIGSKFLKSSVGFGGSCFKKDILNLVYIAQSYGLQEVADYWRQVIIMNDYQQERFVLKMIKNMFNTLAGKKILILGFAFKANTGDTRESPAIYVTKKLLEEHASVIICDPKAIESAKIELKDCKGTIEYEIDPYKAAEECHAIALMTEWSSFKLLDYAKIYKSMVKPAFLFDGRNILDHQEIHKVGFNVYPIGKEALTN
ncbi:MAG: UDP-glucose 6-dehydrogenase [Candidatus Cloacimonadota bacterium]|nr:MAG: UDP-glucose 6-dehydrogenase [Candidatus Cloacimonadota bacterium]